MCIKFVFAHHFVLLNETCVGSKNIEIHVYINEVP